MSAREQMTQRCFLPEQHRTFLQTLRYAVRIKSDADLPKVFQLPVAVALEPSSWKELADRFKVPGNKTDPHRTAFESAMAMYCRSSQYGYALLTCDQLYSIDMKPAGPPGSEDREHGRVLTGTPARGGSHVVPHPPGKANSSAPAPKPTRTGKSGSGGEAVQPAAQVRPEEPTGPKHPQRSRRERQQFHPVQRQKILEKFCWALDLDSEDELPAYLQHELVVPLRVGYSGDLARRYNLVRRKKNPKGAVLGVAMSQYTSSRAYQHALLNCETRFTIDMIPAEPITDVDREQAIATLGEMNRWREEQKQREAANQVRPNITGTTSPASAPAVAAIPVEDENPD